MMIEKSLEEYKALIHAQMGEKRYHHSVAVAKRAVELARRWGADVHQAETAGILHDICKEMPRDVQLQWIKKSGIILDELTKSQPKLWHALAGAGYIQCELLPDEPDIINAVRHHTCGCAQMSVLEKVIYLADLTSEEREYPGIEEMRALADQDMDEAMKQSLQFIVAELAGKGAVISYDTYCAYNWFCRQPRPA